MSLVVGRVVGAALAARYFETRAAKAAPTQPEQTAPMNSPYKRHCGSPDGRPALTSDCARSSHRSDVVLPDHRAGQEA